MIEFILKFIPNLIVNKQYKTGQNFTKTYIVCSGDNSEQQNSFYYESGIAGQSLLQRHLMSEPNDEEEAQDDGSVKVTDGG